MSLLGYDGFDHYDVQADLVTRTGGLVWQAASGVERQPAQRIWSPR